MSVVVLGGLVLFGFAGFSFAPDKVVVNTVPQGVHACQVDADGRGHRIVNRFLTSSGFADAREETGAAGLDTADVRFLSDPVDTQECIQLNTDFGWSDPHSPPESWMYFRSNRGHVFLVYIRPPDPPGEIWLRWTPMLVLDSTYNLLGSYAM